MPLSKSNLPTPALLVDLQQFDANIRKMQTAVSSAGKSLRPHAKAHKCVEIAKRQIAAGAVGVCVATLAEMELMVAARIPVLLTTPVASRVKTDRIAALAARGSAIQVVVDHPMQAGLYQDSAAAHSTKIDVLVDLDVGDHRTGIPCDERAIALARLVASSPNLTLAGLQAYSVSGSHTEGWNERQRHSTSAIAQAIEVQQELLSKGLRAHTLTGGSTGTWDIDIKIQQMTELQAGSYPLMDAAYRRIGGVDFAPAMTVLVTVVSSSHNDRVTVDGGFKAFATDRPFGPEPLNIPGIRWQWGGDEHGILHFESGQRTLESGDRLEFIVPHCDPTVNLYDRIYACRGDVVEAVWPLKRPTLESAPISMSIAS